MFAHCAACTFVGFLLLFFLLNSNGSLSETWHAYTTIVIQNVARYPHGLYILLALVCMGLVPLRAAIDDALVSKGRSNCRNLRAIATAVLVPSSFGVFAFLASFTLAADMTIYARTTAGTFMPIALAFWAALTVPFTLATSKLVDHVR